jgi:hypothetical protein
MALAVLAALLVMNNAPSGLRLSMKRISIEVDCASWMVTMATLATLATMVTVLLVLERLLAYR